MTSSALRLARIALLLLPIAGLASAVSLGCASTSSGDVSSTGGSFLEKKDGYGYDGYGDYGYDNGDYGYGSND